MTRHAEALARRPASPCDRGRAPLGAPPWRFSAVGRASVSGIVPRRPYSDAPRSRVMVPGGRFPEPPGCAGYEPVAAGRHSRLRLQNVSGDARHEPGPALNMILFDSRQGRILCPTDLDIGFRSVYFRTLGSQTGYALRIKGTRTSSERRSRDADHGIANNAHCRCHRALNRLFGVGSVCSFPNREINAA